MTEFYVTSSRGFVNDVFSKAISTFFGEPVDLKFNTYVYDMRPIHWEKTKEGYTCLVHTLGIKPEDLKIEICEDSIKLSAESKYNELDRPFTKNMNIPVDKDIFCNVTKVRYRTENGLTFIYLDVEHKENKIKIERF